MPRQAAGKRLPHGATSTLVLGQLWRLHQQTGQPVPRADLVAAMPLLPETTVDDRLRELVKQQHVLRAGRGLYLLAQAQVHQVTRLPACTSEGGETD